MKRKEIQGVVLDFFLFTFASGTNSLKQRLEDFRCKLYIPKIAYVLIVKDCSVKSLKNYGTESSFIIRSDPDPD